MTRARHDPKSIRATADTLRDLASRMESIAQAMGRNRVIEVDVNHEQKRRAAIFGLDDWVTDAERKLRDATAS